MAQCTFLWTFIILIFLDEHLFDHWDEHSYEPLDRHSDKHLDEQSDLNQFGHSWRNAT